MSRHTPNRSPKASDSFNQYSGPSRSASNSPNANTFSYPRPRTSHTTTPLTGENANFAGAHHFVIKDSQFNDFSSAGSGLKELLKHSMPDAFHNSAARYPPPKCHLGTRNDYVAKIIGWALRNSDRHEPILWMRGPFGVGKSAVAQSCAEALQSKGMLAATLFFSRSNVNRDDPRRVFTSIAYQIASIFRPFWEIVDEHIRNDPALAMKSLSTQFEELLIHPLSHMDNLRSRIEGRVVIIDGLDECRGSPEQCEIIRVIATSARKRTTPFRWLITSRPEDPIIRTMNSPAISPISFHLDLPVSRNRDHEILLFLTDEFNKIRENHDLSESWPSESALALLVDRTAGLWIYVTTITRFITDENSLGPEDQLRIVLAFLKGVSAKVGPDNPLTEMDFFYTLIMQQVPPKIRAIVRKILLLDSVTRRRADSIARMLDLSEEQFKYSCASIQSVAKLNTRQFGPGALHFYHASFLDFMKDPERSRDLCIYGDFLIEYRQERLGWLHEVCSNSTGPSNITFPSEPVLLRGWDRNEYYFNQLKFFWELCCVPNHPFHLQSAKTLQKLQFRVMLRLLGHRRTYIEFPHVQRLRNNLPTDLRDKIIREGKCPRCTNTKDVWILGYGANETVAERNAAGWLRLKDNQNPLPFWCLCDSYGTGIGT